ncbi:MAG: glycine cleavage system aminomethyltransferase GcvT [Pseudomonadales bacterium]
MPRNTALFDEHVNAGAKLVSFHGWEMPLHYGSQLEEHRTVRENAGIFDVSHMTIVDVTGERAEEYLRRLLANDVARLGAPGQGSYGAMLNESGGILDDLVVYRRRRGYRLVVNCATREQDLEWMRRRLIGDVEMNERSDLAMVAVQGPRALEKAVVELPSAIAAEVGALERFRCAESSQWLVARTGYTGEDGIEVMLPAGAAPAFWRALLARGIRPAGLGARDTLRLEAGLNLYGQDMDSTTTPLQSAMGWTVAWEPAKRDFVGRAALEEERARGPEMRLTGIVLEGRGVVRRGQQVIRAGQVAGAVTSGIFSPTLRCGIGFARVRGRLRGECELEIRGRALRARLVKPPFVRDGKKVFE